MQSNCVLYLHPTLGQIYVAPNSADYDDCKLLNKKGRSKATIDKFREMDARIEACWQKSNMTKPGQCDLFGLPTSLAELKELASLANTNKLANVLMYGNGHLDYGTTSSWCKDSHVLAYDWIMHNWNWIQKSHKISQLGNIRLLKIGELYIGIHPKFTGMHLLTTKY